jgi:hypothetical protein
LKRLKKFKRTFLNSLSILKYKRKTINSSYSFYFSSFSPKEAKAKKNLCPDGGFLIPFEIY